MNIPEFSIEHRLITSWLNDFDYLSYEMIKSEKTEFESSGQNPNGVVRFDFDVSVDIKGVGRRAFQLRFARAGTSLKFHVVFERALEI
ncbi:MAG: hypothetical protein AAB575_03405 [Patescibacteria group bacterium]